MALREKGEIIFRGTAMMKKNIATIAIIIAMAACSGCGSLMRSASRGDVEGVKYYIGKGADVNQYDRWGWTPIMWAIYYNYYDVVKCMLENKADPNARTTYDYGTIYKDSTPLIIAATYGYGGIARQLLQHGANPKAVNRQGESAITVAERYNFIEIVNLLEGKGASHYSWDKKVEEKFGKDEAVQTILMNDGSKIVGKIISQTRTQVTVQTKYNTITLDKDKITEMKYK